MANEPDRERSLEALKFYFEFFKHFTTLTTAVTLIVFALSEQLGLGPEVSLVAFLIWVFTLSQSLLGMVVILSQIIGADLVHLLFKGSTPSSLQRLLDRIPALLSYPGRVGRDEGDPFAAPGFWIWVLMLNTVIAFFVGVFTVTIEIIGSR